MIEYSFSDVKGTNRHGYIPQGKILRLFISLFVIGILSMSAFIVMVILFSLAIIPSDDLLIVVLFILFGGFLLGIPSFVLIIRRVRVRKLFCRCLEGNGLKRSRAVVQLIRGKYNRIRWCELKFKVDGYKHTLTYSRDVFSYKFTMKWHADILYSPDYHIAFILNYDYDINSSVFDS